MKNVTVYVLAKTSTNIAFTFADLSKEVEILDVNTENKFSFNSSTKIPVEKLVSCSVTSLEWLHILITIIKKSR